MDVEFDDYLVFDLLRLSHKIPSVFFFFLINCTALILKIHEKHISLA